VEVPVQLRLYKSVKLWSFYVDLEESLGDLASTRRVYERILELRIATPQIIINYAALLEVSPPRTADKGGCGHF
jgi:pre-mRNA-splicing factor SYF1